MTTTAIIVATTAASTAVTGTLAAGSSKAFGCVGLQSDKGEFVKIEQPNAAGSSWSTITYEGNDGKFREAKLSKYRTSIVLNGPIDYRINKSATANALEVVEYT